MRTAGKAPIRIISGGVNATTVMQGSKRAWSYDPAEGVTDDDFEIVSGSGGAGTSFTRWIANRGQGMQVAAFRAGSGDVAYGGVMWHSFYQQVRTVNGISCDFSYPGVTWGAQAGGMLPAIPAFDTLLYTGGAAAGGFRVALSGLVPGRSYVVQIIVADARVGAGVGPRTLKITPLRGLGTIHAPQLEPRYAYEGETKYAVYSLRFTAPADGGIEFRPDTFNGATYTELHINAINVLQDVMPQGKFFYVANDGNDNADGMSRETPWASLSRVHERTYGPGDCLLFKRGHQWTGRLTPQGSGAAGQPIILSAYGDGAHPLIDGAGFEAGGPMGGIHLSGQSYWTIDGFEVTNWGTAESYRHGIFIGGGNQKGVVVRNNYVHDIKGGYRATSGVPSRHTGGISFYPQTTGNFDDILIENNVVERVIGTGIQVWGPYEYESSPGVWTMDWAKLLKNVVIRGNTVWASSGDNILYQGCKDALVEFNHSGFSGMHGRWPGSIAGLWGTRSDGGTQQYNHSHDSMTWSGVGESFDAQGLGIDIWMRGETVLQYNFTHDNYGGFALDYFNGYEPGATLTCRYNVSVNEPRITKGRAGLYFNNVFYSPTDPFQLHWSPASMTMRNCVVLYQTLDASWNTAALLVNNVWWGDAAKPSIDTVGAKVDPQFVSPLPNLIFRDEYVSYAEGDPNTAMTAGQLERRWFGSLKSARYNFFGEPTAFYVGRQRCLELINPSGPSALALVGNLAANAQGPLTVRMLVRNQSAADPTNWLGLLFKDSAYSAKPFVADSTVRFGALIRANGECQAFLNGTGIEAPQPWQNQCGTSEYHLLDFVFTDTAGTGNAFVGKGTRIRMFSDGLLLGTYDVTQMSQLNFAFNVYGSTWWVRRLHVMTRNGEWDAYDDYVGLLPSATSPLLNTGTVIAANTKDFLRNAIDGTPNRGAFEVTTLAGYAQTVTFIEVSGRYRVQRPASGTREFNFRSIVRDQNFRVMTGQAVTWSMYPAISGATLDAATGVVTLTSTAAAGRFALKASAGGITKAFPVTVV